MTHHHPEHQNHEHEAFEAPVPSQEFAEPVAQPAKAALGTQAWMLPASILLAAVLISGSIIYLVQGGKGATAAPTDTTQQGGAVQATAPTTEDRDVILGKADAPVSIVAYEDFQCPFCGQYFSETESQIRTAYVDTGKVKLVYRHLAFLGPESNAAAEASECAKDQGKFWDFHDALFNAEIADGEEHNGNLKRSLFVQLAKELKLNETDFAKCIDSKKYADYVTQQTEDANKKYGVQSTPTIFVNDQKVEGAYPFATFQGLIDGFLNK